MNKYLKIQIIGTVLICSIIGLGFLIKQITSEYLGISIFFFMMWGVTVFCLDKKGKEVRDFKENYEIENGY